MRIILTLTFFIIFIIHSSFADCTGCCSRSGGVCCIGGITMCCNGSPLSDTCKAKGCSVCSVNNPSNNNNSNNQNVKIRLYGIDCPESSQSYGAEATQFTKNLVLNKSVKVEKKDTDYYGRVIGLVYLPDGRLLNKLLVENGYAWVYDIYCQIPECSNWKNLETQAKNKKLGLWKDPNPIPPWQYRKQSLDFIFISSVPSVFTGNVISVSDGDTITVEITSTNPSTSPSTSNNNKGGGCYMGNSNSFWLISLFIVLLILRKTKGATAP